MMLMMLLFLCRDGNTNASPGPKSPNSHLDSDTRRRFTVADDHRTHTRTRARTNQPVPVRLRQRSSSRCADVLHRYLSNEGSTASWRRSPVSRCRTADTRPSGVDHIRGSQCFINADLHNSATIPYQGHPEAASRSPTPSSAAASPPPQAVANIPRRCSSLVGSTPSAQPLTQGQTALSLSESLDHERN
ncbi:hypothetical protein INR49_020802 [Caranx melampygus]|nr:hypothetical protein INR49_020802 [Caranx melampygus]